MQVPAMSFISQKDKTKTDTKSDFSIDHILHGLGGKRRMEPELIKEESKEMDWINCTRYRPPKLPRQKKKEGIRRRSAGRNPRIPFSGSQIACLEAKFTRTPYLSSTEVKLLASYLKLSETRVKIWFQNRRARERREKDTSGKGDNLKKDKSPSPLRQPPSSDSCQFLPFRPQFLRWAESVDYIGVIAPLNLSGIK